MSVLSPQPPNPLTYFIDRSLGRFDVANALRGVGRTVEVHHDHFRHDEADDVWIKQVSLRGWVILTKDLNIRRNPLEFKALVSNGARAFLLHPGNITGPEMAAIFGRALAGMERVLGRQAPPFIAKVYTDASIRLFHP